MKTRRKEMDKFLSIFQRLWSVNPSDTRVGKEQIMIWAKTEYGRDWRHAYDHFLCSGQMPRQVAPKGLRTEEVKVLRNV